MGDRCALTVTFHERDRDVVEELLGPWDQEDRHADLPGCLTVWISEINYGGCGEREELARRGVPFLGHHCAGDDYGPVAFAACDGRIDEIDADHGGKPSVQIDESSGMPTREARRSAKQYVERLNLTRRRLRQRDGPGTQPRQRIVVELQGGLVQAVHGPGEPEVVVVDWDDRHDDRGPMVAGWDPTPLSEMAQETRDALKGSVPDFTFDEPDPRQDGDTTLDTLSHFIREKGFIVLGWNRVNPSPGNPVEAWAYEGPLSFANAASAGFGLGADCNDAMRALDQHLASRKPTKAKPSD